MLAPRELANNSRSYARENFNILCDKYAEFSGAEPASSLKNSLELRPEQRAKTKGRKKADISHTGATTNFPPRK